jgi:hypothetical protein
MDLVPPKKKKKRKRKRRRKEEEEKKKTREEALLITFNVPDECSDVQNIDQLSGFEQILEPPLSPAYASVDS